MQQPEHVAVELDAEAGSGRHRPERRPRRSARRARSRPASSTGSACRRRRSASGSRPPGASSPRARRRGASCCASTAPAPRSRRSRRAAASDAGRPRDGGRRARSARRRSRSPAAGAPSRSRTCWWPAARRCRRDTAAIPEMPGVGSSRYSTTPSSRDATSSEVDGVHAPLGSSRNGSVGKASRKASMASHSSVGWEDSALQLQRTEAPAVDHRAGLLDELRGVQRLAPRVVGEAGMPGPLVEEVAAERHGRTHPPTEDLADGLPGDVPLQVEARDLERGVDGLDRGVHVEHAAEAGARLPPVSRPSTSTTTRRRPARSKGSMPGIAAATASSRARCASSAYVSPNPRRPESVWSSTIARSAHGWWTPTTLSSGGSANATGVTTTREMRELIERA